MEFAEKYKAIVKFALEQGFILLSLCFCMLFFCRPLVAILILYSFFACITAGSSISTGLVIPMLFIGSMYGRLFAYGLVRWFGVHGKSCMWSMPGLPLPGLLFDTCSAKSTFVATRNCEEKGFTFLQSHLSLRKQMCTSCQHSKVRSQTVIFLNSFV